MDILITPEQLTRLTEGRVRPVPWVTGIRFGYRPLEDGTLRVVSMDLLKGRGRYQHTSSTYGRRSYWSERFTEEAQLAARAAGYMEEVV